MYLESHNDKSTCTGCVGINYGNSLSVKSHIEGYGVLLDTHICRITQHRNSNCWPFVIDFLVHQRHCNKCDLSATDSTVCSGDVSRIYLIQFTGTSDEIFLVWILQCTKPLRHVTNTFGKKFQFYLWKSMKIVKLFLSLRIRSMAVLSWTCFKTLQPHK